MNYTKCDKCGTISNCTQKKVPNPKMLFTWKYIYVCFWCEFKKKLSFF